MVSAGIRNLESCHSGDNTGVLVALKKGRSRNNAATSLSAGLLGLWFPPTSFWTPCMLHRRLICRCLLSQWSLGIDKTHLPVLFVLPSALYPLHPLNVRETITHPHQHVPELLAQGSRYNSLLCRKLGDFAKTKKNQKNKIKI